ncbi:MAG: hypothetical protein KBI35_01885 [Ruminococcus sp.]|nr:hypothetical protein [Ruminococcus sp.]MBQ8123563.1 hypothetical protein [Ruminococcus sp.]HOO05078.1 hypothetical protein [Ruminococcus sp.]
MDIKAIAKGTAAGAAAGLACYALASASAVKKHSIKRDAGKAMKAAEVLLRDIKSVIM